MIVCPKTVLIILHNQNYTQSVYGYIALCIFNVLYIICEMNYDEILRKTMYC
jgi:uncharacterized membrane protein (DUF106 family)